MIKLMLLMWMHSCFQVDLEQLNQRLEVVLLVDLAMPRHLREVLLGLPPQEGPLRASEAQAVVEASVEAQRVGLDLLEQVALDVLIPLWEA